jgi:hypothetical protein
MDPDIAGDGSLTPQRSPRTPDSIAGDVAQPQPRIRRSAPVALNVGPLCVFLIVAFQGGWSAKLPQKYRRGLPAADIDVDGTRHFLVGAALGRWYLNDHATAASTDNRKWITTAADYAVTRGSSVKGYIAYEAEQIARFAEPLAIDVASTALALLLQVNPLLLLGGSTFREWVEFHGICTIPIIVTLETSLALVVIRHGWMCFYAVALTTGRSAKRKMLESRASWKVMRRWLRDQVAVASRRIRHNRVAGKGWESALPADLVIDWVRTTIFMKDTKLTKEASKAFARVLCRKNPKITSAELVSQCEYCGREVLRRARVRIDAVAALLFRMYFMSLHTRWYMNLWADGSPLWNGTEMFASSFDLTVRDSTHRRLLPCVRLPRDFMGAKHKCLALLWQLYLLMGPCFESMRKACEGVRSITTDMGTERLLAGMDDILVTFFRLIGARPDPRMCTVAKLFPRALVGQGWRHSWDVVLRRALFSLPFFPVFLKRTKAITYFLRDKSNLSAIVANLKSRGLHGLAAILGGVSLPNFAKWRWATLDDVLRELASFWESLAQHFDVRVFANVAEADNKSRLKLVVEAFSSSDYRIQFKGVAWLCDWITCILRFAGACTCHLDLFLRREDVDCPNKGRILNAAYDYAMTRLREGLVVGNSWLPAYFEGDIAIWQAMQGSVRATVALGATKMKVFDTIPYLFGRLRQAGVKQRVLEQFNSVREDSHDEATLHVMSPSRPLRNDFDLLGDDGSNMSDALAFEDLGRMGRPRQQHQQEQQQQQQQQQQQKQQQQQQQQQQPQQQQQQQWTTYLFLV